MDILNTQANMIDNVQLFNQNNMCLCMYVCLLVLLLVLLLLHEKKIMIICHYNHHNIL